MAAAAHGDGIGPGAPPPPPPPPPPLDIFCTVLETDKKKKSLYYLTR